MGRKHKYNIPKPDTSSQGVGLGNYTFGKATEKLNEFKREKPVYSFKFASLNGGAFCFNSKRIDGAKDFFSLISGLKRVSDLDYNSLSTNRQFHFHEVLFDDVDIQESSFIKCITNNPKNIDREQIPTLYQIKVFKESRVMGFFYSKIFHLVFFDVNHKAYARK